MKDSSLAGVDLMSAAVATRTRAYPARRHGAPCNQTTSGFTVLELMFVIAIVAIVTMLAVGQYSEQVERARVATAKVDIRVIAMEIQRYENNEGAYPPSLDEIGRGGDLDPWQRAYHYVDISGGNRGAARKDRRLNPLNSDFDLFSVGKDGVSHTQVSHEDSLDDVIRARDGTFVDLAEKF